jgi:hypothetical protein
MQVNRGLVFWGVALITAGTVALAIQGGAIDEEAARDAWRLWPIALIIIGLAIIAARTPFALVVTLVAGVAVGGLAGTLAGGWPDGLSVGCGGELDESTTERGTLDAQAEVELDFNCGDLEVAMAAGRGWSLHARSASGAAPEVVDDDGPLRIRSDGGGIFNDSRQAWEVRLPADVDLSLGVSANASSTTLDLASGSFADLRVDANAGDLLVDLSGASVADLSIDANAGSVSVVADGATTASGSIELNAGSLELCVPEELAVSITMTDTNITFSHNLDDLGLTRSGDTWSTGVGSPDLELDVDGNAASFTMNPDGGCA